MVEITYQMVLNTLQTVDLLVGIAYYITIARAQLVFLDLLNHIPFSILIR
jgi:hypothetical protein